MPKAGEYKDISGNVYGRLTAKSIHEIKNRKSYWLCECECGNTHVASLNSLRSGSTKSCGCLVREILLERNSVHGMAKSPEYYIWAGMMKRCRNTKSKSYRNYGGRGIEVCDRWTKFENFYADMGRRPSHQHSIDRINNDGDYCPENCRWGTRSEQNNNTRRVRRFSYQGESLTVSQWAKKAGIPYTTLYSRLVHLGWPIDRAVAGR